MTTTLEKFAGTTRPNYCTLPTIDVEILPDEHRCNGCGSLITRDPNAGYFGTWVHADTTLDDGHHVTPRTRCSYCHSNDDATFSQQSWHDQIHCTRCGGTWGFPIGD